MEFTNNFTRLFGNDDKSLDIVAQYHLIWWCFYYIAITISMGNFSSELPEMVSLIFSYVVFSYMLKTCLINTFKYYKL